MNPSEERRRRRRKQCVLSRTRSLTQFSYSGSVSCQLKVRYPIRGKRRGHSVSFFTLSSVPTCVISSEFVADTPLKVRRRLSECVCVCLFQTCVSIKECVCISSVGDRGVRSPGSAGSSRGAELNSQISRKSSWFLCFHSRNLREVRQGSSNS